MTKDEAFAELEAMLNTPWRCNGTNCPVTSENYLVAEHSPECEAEMCEAEDAYERDE